MNPRVLLVSRALPCHLQGGLERHVVDLATAMARLGARVHLLSAAAPPDFAATMRERGVTLHGLPRVAPSRYTLAYLRRVGPAIDRLDAIHRFDVIHGQEFGLGFWNPEAATWARVALTVHGTLTSETPLHPDVFATLGAVARLKAIARYGRRLAFARHWLRAIDRSAAVLVDSDFTRREIERLRPAARDRLRKVPLGVDPELHPAIDRSEARAALGWTEDDAPRLVTVGRLEWQKGIDLAIEALNRLRSMPWRCVIAGDGAERSRLARSVEVLGLGDRIELIGRVDDARKALLLAGADLFVWPERTHPAFGLVGLEAMLMGTPVLASRRGAIPELIDDASGWLFDPVDAGRLAEALRSILSDPEGMRRRREGLRERALARFGVEAMARATLEVYGERIEGRRGER